ncbi:MAG: hypothetical protein QME49_01975 [bacterium]|nr:hypothetical protein [bacterium]
MKKAAIALLGCIILVGIGILFIPHSPELVVNNPMDGFITDKDTIEVKGKVSLKSVVKAAVISHNKEISVVFAKPLENGEYQATLCLRDSSMFNELPMEGTYTIKVSALNAAKKVSVIERNIVFRLDDVEQATIEAAKAEKAKQLAIQQAEAEKAAKAEKAKQLAIQQAEEQAREAQQQADAFKAGLELRQAGKIKEAIDAFSKVASDDPDYLKAVWNISILSLSVNQCSRTLKGMEEISRSSGETAFTCFYSGVAHYKMARKQASFEDADKAVKMYYQAIKELEKAYVKRQDFSRIKISQVAFNPPQKNIHDIRYYQSMCYYFIYKWERTQGELEDAKLQKVKMQARDAFNDYFSYFTNLSEDTKSSCNSLYNNALQVNKEL